jgi:hypothetical protein
MGDHDWSIERVGFENGVDAERKALANTLTRLRATVKDLESGEDRAYVRALEHLAEAQDLKITTVVKFEA